MHGGDSLATLEVRRRTIEAENRRRGQIRAAAARRRAERGREEAWKTAGNPVAAELAQLANANNGVKKGRDGLWYVAGRQLQQAKNVKVKVKE